MWILESNGDFLQGKRMWLKPGKKYLFGRVKKDGVRFAIDHKTVSRKHFVITVAEVKDEDVGRVHARTKVTITDENSKAGTNIDGELIKDKSQELKNAITSIRPGSCPHELLIKWLPCTLTFGLLKKEIKNGVLKTKQERVKELDIKAVSDYLSAETTHLVAQKRNTPKGLQALIEGKPIVSEAYIDALIYASTPTDLQEEENLSPLEIDFDDAWPDPTRHLPPAGKEPTNKPAEAYKPDPTRAKVFEKCTFFFFDQTQYDVLLPPITTGHGKALLFKPQQETTTLEEGLAFVRKAVGTHGHAIIIKLNEANDMQSWLVKYIEDLCSRFGQEPANQSDLLDTILTNNASQLCKPRTRTSPDKKPAVPLSESATAINQESQVNGHQSSSTRASASGARVRDASPLASLSSAPPSRPQSPNPESAPYNRENTQQSSVEDDNPRPRKRSRFVPIKKALDPFDDDFNPDAIAVYDEEPPAVRTQSRSQRSVRSQVDEEDVSVKDEPTPRVDRNNSTTPSVVADSDDDLDELLPAGAAMRKAKQREAAEARRNGQPIKSALAQSKTAAQAKPKKEVKLLDVREAARAHREAEDAAEQKERRELDDLQAEDEGMSGPANLVRVVEYKLPVRGKSSEGTNGYRGETWKPEWDGRKNFKGFRRARDMANGVAPRRPKDKIIVPLIAVKKDTYGLGDQYWEKTEEDKERAAREKERKKRASQKSSQSQKHNSKHPQRSTTVNEDSDSDEDSLMQTNGDDGADQVSPETARLQHEAEGVLDHPIDVDAPRQTRGGDTQTQSSKPSTAATSRSTNGPKRPASSTPSGRAATAKKQKTLPVTVVHDSDSDEQDDDSDDMKFKFGRGRKARAVKS